MAPSTVRSGRKLGERLRWTTAALRAGDLEEAWRRFEYAMYQWHAAASPAFERLRARGKVVTRPAPEAEGQLERCLTPEVLEWRRRLALLQLAFSASAATPPDEAAARRHMEQAADDVGPEHPWRQPLVQWTVEALPGLLASAQHECRAAEVSWRAANRDRWHRYCTDEWLAGGRRLYAWLRADPAEPAPADADLPPLGSEADLKRLDQHWQALWTAPVGELQLEEWLAPLGDLPPMADLEPLRPEDLDGVIR